MRISDWSSDVCYSDLFGEIFSHGPRGRSGRSPDIEKNRGWKARGFRRSCGAAGDGWRARVAGREPWVAIPSPARRRSPEERRVWKEWVSTCRSWWSPSHEKKKQKHYIIQPRIN